MSDSSAPPRERARGHTRLRAADVYEVVRQEGEDELRRPVSSLWWSGVAAGIAISGSVTAEGLLHAHLPAFPGREAVTDLGYCFGFVICIMGRMQLFTENTITPVLPLFAKPSWRGFVVGGRMWAVVFAANMLGALVAAVFASKGKFVDPENLEAMLEVSRAALDKTVTEAFLRGVPAGFFVAAIVWLLPSSNGNGFWVIVLLTYLIALGDFSHVIAGGVEAFLLLIAGERGVLDVALFIVPALAGNVVGGTVLFALLAYGQVAQEID